MSGPLRPGRSFTVFFYHFLVHLFTWILWICCPFWASILTNLAQISGTFWDIDFVQFFSRILDMCLGHLLRIFDTCCTSAANGRFSENVCLTAVNNDFPGLAASIFHHLLILFLSFSTSSLNEF